MPKLVKRVLSLTPEQSRFLDRCVSRDGYPSASHAAQHAIDTLMAQFEMMSTPEFTEMLKREVAPVIERIRRGEEKLIPAEQVFDELETMIKAKIKAAE